MSVATGKEDAAFVVNEPTPYTLTLPVGTDFLGLIADADVGQMKAIANSLEAVNSLDIEDVLDLRYNPADLNLQFYMKRTGTPATTVPAIDTIHENGFGIKDTSSGVSTVYRLRTPTTVKKNFSLFYKKGGIGMQVSGCFINEMTWPIVAPAGEAAAFRCNASGEGGQLRWVGTTTITEAIATTDAALDKFKVAVADLTPYDGTATVALSIAGKFTIGGYVMIGALLTPHKITDINPTTGVVTFTPALASTQASGSVVYPYMPTISNTGTAISGHKGYLVYDGDNFTKILSATPHLKIPRRMLNEEKNNLDFPSDDAFDGDRVITIDNMNSYFDPRGTPKQDIFLALANRRTRKVGSISVGNVAGLIYKFDYPALITSNPKVSGRGLVTLSQIQNAMPSSGNDGMILTAM